MTPHYCEKCLQYPSFYQGPEVTFLETNGTAFFSYQSREKRLFVKAGIHCLSQTEIFDV
jgi:hypothetical protein